MDLGSKPRHPIFFLYSFGQLTVSDLQFPNLQNSEKYIVGRMKTNGSN